MQWRESQMACHFACQRPIIELMPSEVNCVGQCWPMGLWVLLVQVRDPVDDLSRQIGRRLFGVQSAT